MGAREFYVWFHWCLGTFPKHIQMAKLCQFLLLISATLENNTEVFYDDKTFYII